MGQTCADCAYIFHDRMKTARANIGKHKFGLSDRAMGELKTLIILICPEVGLSPKNQPVKPSQIVFDNIIFSSYCITQ